MAERLNLIAEYRARLIKRCRQKFPNEDTRPERQHVRVKVFNIPFKDGAKEQTKQRDHRECAKRAPQRA